MSFVRRSSYRESGGPSNVPEETLGREVLSGGPPIANSPQTKTFLRTRFTSLKTEQRILMRRASSETGLTFPPKVPLVLPPPHSIRASA